MSNHRLPIGRQLNLVSDTLVGSYSFHPAGHVSATIGAKNGPLAAPVFSYRVTSEDSVEIIDSNGRIERWDGIRVEGDLLHVECNGQPRTFIIGKPTP